MGALGVTIRGERYKHLVYRFVLPYSNWESVAIASSETFEALVGGLQESLWELGGVPREHRTDNLSAATHELRQSGGRAFNRAYEEFLAHYGLAASRNYPGNAHENGDVEAAHGHFKTAVDQRLRLSGHAISVPWSATRGCWTRSPGSATAGAGSGWRRSRRRCGRCRRGGCRCTGKSGAR